MQELSKNDEIVLLIEELGANGEGIAHFNGAVVFVKFALPGEEVLAHIILCKENFYVAKIVKILKTSNSRVTPPCPYFEKCGGCDIQHLSNTSELDYKTKLVKDTIFKYAKIDHEVLPIIHIGKGYHYRNKFAFPVSEVEGKVKIGMYKKNSHEIVDIDDCLLQSFLAKKILKLFRAFMEENKISAYNEFSKTGEIKHIVVREHENKFILTVVVSGKHFNKFNPLIQKLQTLGMEFGLYKNINTLNNNVIFGEKDEHIFGLKELSVNEFGIDYKINNRSFMQVNDQIKTEIYKKITQEIEEDETVIDAYSGAGLLSAIVAKKAKLVYGIEIVKQATENAEFLKTSNGIKNLININGDCAKVLPKLAKDISGDFSVILDPPRKGIDKKVAEAVVESKPSKVIYLSCNPATLARDLALLAEIYSIDYIQPYNMFPQTANVETLVCLKRKEAN